jgi:thymidylate synthase
MRILAIITGEYGQRHVDNIQATAAVASCGPDDWQIEVWQAPAILPPIVDYPEDYLPESLPSTDLILAFGEHKGVAELIPEIARMTGARAVIAPVDREEWLPRGLARQLRGWLEDMDVACVTPKPLCSLTETHYNVRRHRQEYDDPRISKFARYFGRPKFHITVDPDTRTITEVDVVRDAVCGCAHHVAQGLVGVSANDAGQEAGLLHHHYPCLAGMGKDPDFNDTIMHISGNILKDEVGEQVRPYREIAYVVPGKLSEE